MRALVTVDLDGDADHVDNGLAPARSLTERLSATVDLLHVAPSPALPRYESLNGEMRQLLEAALLRAEENALARLNELLSTWPPERRGRADVRRAPKPADEIVSRASGYDLIVVGTHGRRGWEHAWLGSVAEVVVRLSPIPVLVVHGTASPTENRFLVAIDVWDEGAEAIVRQAGDIAARAGGTVDLIHVAAPVASTGQALAIEASIAAIEKRLSTLASSLPEGHRGGSRVDAGDIVRLVTAAAERYTMLFAGTHGRTGLSHVVLGSVAERLVRRSPIPVIVVPTSR